MTTSWAILAPRGRKNWTDSQVGKRGLFCRDTPAHGQRVRVGLKWAVHGDLAMRRC